jgi:hypothetical protein
MQVNPKLVLRSGRALRSRVINLTIANQTKQILTIREEERNTMRLELH